MCGEKKILSLQNNAQHSHLDDVVVKDQQQQQQHSNSALALVPEWSSNLNNT
jgi:hypothetical protein